MNYFDGIISNPPYISRKEWKNLSDEVRSFDPPDALLGGETESIFITLLKIFRIFKTGRIFSFRNW